MSNPRKYRLRRSLKGRMRPMQELLSERQARNVEKEPVRRSSATCKKKSKKRSNILPERVKLPPVVSQSSCFKVTSRDRTSDHPHPTRNSLSIDDGLHHIMHGGTSSKVRQAKGRTLERYGNLTSAEEPDSDLGIHDAEVSRPTGRAAQSTVEQERKRFDKHLASHDQQQEQVSFLRENKPAEDHTQSQENKVGSADFGINSTRKQYGSLYKKQPLSCSDLCGLVNLGNTCFMNSALQCLCNTGPLRNYFTGCNLSGHLYYKEDIKQKGETGETLADVFSDLLQQMQNSTGKFYSVRPDSFKRKLGKFAHRFSGYSQQDTQEFLTFLLEGLHNDLNTATGEVVTSSAQDESKVSIDESEKQADQEWKEYLKDDNSFIVKLFQGQMRSSLKCGIETCGKEIWTFDTFMFLTVPLPDEVATVPECTYQVGRSASHHQSCTLENCLELMTKETSSGEKNWFCSECKSLVELKRKVDLCRVPEILVVYIKRFRVTMYARYKLTTCVEFPDRLDLSSFVTENLRNSNLHYELFATINHYGSAYGGHYVAHAQTGDRWYTFNDEMVTPLHPEELAGQQHTSSAYVLFYRLKKSAGTTVESAHDQSTKSSGAVSVQKQKRKPYSKEILHDKCYTELAKEESSFPTTSHNSEESHTLTQHHNKNMEYQSSPMSVHSNDKDSDIRQPQTYDSNEGQNGTEGQEDNSYSYII